MASLQSLIVTLVLKWRGSKKVFSSAELTRRRVAALQQNPQDFAPPPRIHRRVDVAQRSVGGWPVYEVLPRGVSPARRALYLHGGAYIYEIQPQHWDFIAELAASTQTRITVPIYPLAPGGTAAEIVPAATKLLAAIIFEAGADNTTLIGDSAGGGMALAAAMHARDRGLPAPNRIVLISPWLDVSLSDPGIAALEPRDPWLGIDGARAAGELYRGLLAPHDPRVSPLYGELRDLAPITLISGTRDILNCDARRLVGRAWAVGVTIDFHETPDMLHVFPLLPIPEARPARAVIRAAMG
jgi:acetyl esterase/lipase